MTTRLAALSIVACALFLVGRPARAQETTLSIGFSEPAAGAVIRGTVFEDRDADGKPDPAKDAPVEGVLVTDGEKVVATASNGWYELPLSAGAQFVYIAVPADRFSADKFYHRLQRSSHSGRVVDRAYDFRLRPKKKSGQPLARFVHATDFHIADKADGKRLADAIENINRLSPPAQFVVATGDLTNDGSRPEQWYAYTTAVASTKLPWYHLFGEHDSAGAEQPLRHFHDRFGPDYYSVDFGKWHLVMLNSAHRSARQEQWLARNLRLAGSKRQIILFQHHPPTDADLDELRNHNVRAVFSGHLHSNGMTSRGKGTAIINQSPLMMGGIDGSPAGFRIVSIYGDQINSEFRFGGLDRHLHIVYPQQELSGPERLLATVYDTTAEVAEVRFRVVTPDNPAFAEGRLAKVGPMSWMAPFSARELGLKGALPAQFMLRVRATNIRGDQWEATQYTSQPARDSAAADVKTGRDWPQFMGNAQRTGATEEELRLPLKLRWITPTHGSIDLGSPVLFKGQLAIGVKDRDNLINNGVAILDAKTGRTRHFVKTSAMINHTPAFAEDAGDGPGILFATAADGSVYQINPKSGHVESRTSLGDAPDRCIYSAPAIQGNIAVMGSSALLMSISPRLGQSRWTSNFGLDSSSSYASPSLAGPLVVMGANWLRNGGKMASIYALDARTGNVQWTNECPGLSGSVCVLPGRGFAIDQTGRFKAMDLENGDDLLSRELETGWSLSTPAADREVIVVPTGSGTVHAFDPATLEPRWKFGAGTGILKIAPYNKSNATVFSSPTLTPSLVFIGSSDGKIYALDKRSGAELWSYDFGVPVLSTPCISGNALFVAAYDGNVYAFTAR